ncbi:hypothetical protein H8356DRAFT_1677116 [Neocallimastix lanati (nom. inval.)]|nr:hypothetical protein H8356DRAFT_1677116 [Neocallimastix sp. JGI-2020a]
MYYLLFLFLVQCWYLRKYTNYTFINIVLIVIFIYYVNIIFGSTTTRIVASIVIFIIAIFNIITAASYMFVCKRTK